MARRVLPDGSTKSRNYVWAHFAYFSLSLKNSPLLYLITRISVPASPPKSFLRSLALAITNVIDPNKVSEDGFPVNHLAFVDDNLMAEVYPCIRLAKSVLRFLTLAVTDATDPNKG